MGIENRHRMVSKTSTKFEGLQLLRAVAAIAVLGYHAAAVERETGASYQRLLGFFEHFGYAGVDLFFVLSGFIITWTARNYSPDLRGITDYVGERLARIFPIFWVIWLISALTYYVVFKQNYCHPDDVLASATRSLSLVSQQGHCILPQAWTLSWELLFYLVVGALLPVFLAHKFVVASAWTALVLANIAFGFTEALVLSYFCLYFIAGIVIAALIERRAVYAPRAFTAIGMLWLVGASIANWRFGIASDDLLVRFVGFGVGSALTIYGLVATELVRDRSRRHAASLLGDASYSIYLFHVTALFLMSKMYLANSSPAAHYAWVAGLLIVPLALSSILFMALEKPMLRWFRSHRNGLRKAMAVATMGLVVVFAAPMLISSAPNTRISAHDPTLQPVALSEAVASRADAVHRVRKGDVEKISKLMACSLDSLNGAAPGAAPISNEGVLVLSGWSQYPAGSESMTVVLQGMQTYAFKAQLGQARPDIAKITGSPQPISDIMASSQLRGIAGGRYSVVFVRSEASNLSKCIATTGIELGEKPI